MIPAGIQLRLLAALVALVATGAIGWRAGSAHVHGQWADADLARERAAQTLAANDRRRAGDAAAEFEAQAATRRAAAATLLPEVRHALQQPISCPAGQSQPLADVPVPADVTAGLRRAAGDDPPADRSAAGKSGG